MGSIQGRFLLASIAAVCALFLLTASPEAPAAQGVGENCHVGKKCGDGLHCMPFRQVCHRDSGAQEGEACQAGYGCASGFTCEAGTQKCRGPGKVGDACHATKPCGSGLTCAPGVQKCYHSPRAEGEPCVAGYPCGSGLKCAAGKQQCVSSSYPVQQCVYNQSGYVAQIKWFEDGTMTSTKNGDADYTIKATKPAFKTETIPLGQKSCVGGPGSKNWAVLTIKGGKYARAAAIVATDIGAAGATTGCWVGVAALTVVTAGGGAVAGVGCEVVTDAAVGVIADPSIIPDSKELFAVVQPAASGGEKPLWIIMYGTVFKPETRTGRP
jgi:hypothetical protein